VKLQIYADFGPIDILCSFQTTAIMAGCMTGLKGENLVSAVLRCPEAVCRQLRPAICPYILFFLVHGIVIGSGLSRFGRGQGSAVQSFCS
jgi:hypothetical protein